MGRAAEHANPADGPDDGQLPDRVVEKLTECTKRGPTPLQPLKHTVSFDVFMDPDGWVDNVALRTSTFHLDDVEACMENALHALSCCKNTEDGPVLEEGLKCYEHNTAYVR